LRIVFHGTDDENIEPILANGMDPSRRGMHGQVHGPGEYFATRALTSVRFALRNRPGRLRGRLLIFLVSEKEVLPQAPDVVVVNDVSRELPLGTVTFQMADAKVSELDEKARKAKAAAERAKAAAERTNSTVPLQAQVPPSHTQVPLGESRSSEGHQASSGVIGRHQASSGESRSSEEALRRALGRRHAPRSTVVAVMKELKRFHQGSRGGSGRCVERDATDGTADDADADDDFRALLLDDADVLRWRVEMRLPPDSLLGAQLAAHAARWGGGAVVELEVLFGDDFPASPPFVRVVSPRFAFHTGHVTVGGSICMQLLTTSGWDSSFTVEAALVMVRDAMLSGHGALDSSRAHYGAQPPLPTGT
jgi:ubiquitin-protein ligase